jgi:riboflavin kinase/FMN adenylyltransferase
MVRPSFAPWLTIPRTAYGIYAVSARIPAAGATGLAGAQVVLGAANLGIRPTFDPPIELLEPTFFDFSGDLYGREIEVAFHAFIRPEAKFDSLDALTAQIAADCVESRRVLAEMGIAAGIVAAG